MLRRFLASEAAGGLLLMSAAALALVVANSPLAPAYFAALHAEALGLDTLHWINDGLMALFFLLVGLEIKRELLTGQLARWSDRALPGIAALGGVVVPALIYLAINRASPGTLRGWAIPAATDIAFALGILSLLGDRVPVSLKLFLTTLAILDDLAAVAIIALFYTAGLSWPALAGAMLATAALAALNRFKVAALAPYLAVGILLWFCVLKSGVHATVAGVVLAMAIPIANHERRSPLHRLEHALAPWVAFLVLPLFGFANAGVSFAGMSLGIFARPVTLGIAAGLFAGKQLGVMAAAWLTVRTRLATLPAGASWRQFHGVAVLCGVGFTMSLFIGLLAFPDVAIQDEVKVGVLAGSLLSGLCGWALLYPRGGGGIRAGAAPKRGRPGAFNSRS